MSPMVSQEALATAIVGTQIEMSPTPELEIPGMTCQNL